MLRWTYILWKGKLWPFIIKLPILIWLNNDENDIHPPNQLSLLSATEKYLFLYSFEFSAKVGRILPSIKAYALHKPWKASYKNLMHADQHKHANYGEYSRTSIAHTPLKPWKYVWDRGSLS